MKCSPSKFFRISSSIFVALYIAFATIAITACSNSEAVGADIEESAAVHCKDADAEISPTQEQITTKKDSLKADTDINKPTSKDSIYPNKVAEATTKNDSSMTDTIVTESASIDSVHPHEIVCDSVSECLSLDDTEYPYVGIPRIVIETENHSEIKDEKTEVSAKLQIWGKKSPESDVMELTIRGRGNSTWGKPKKPYSIKFKEKQSLLGMAEAKKWVLLANYLDRTLIRNAVAFEIAKKTNLEWTPSGKFAEIFLNGKFLGNYFICEKVQINKNRLNISKDSYLLEFDVNYDEDYKFKTSIKDLPIYIKNLDEPSEAQIAYITAYIDTIECILYRNCRNVAIENYLDLQSFVDYLIVNELTENSEPLYPKSVFMYKDTGLLKAGPVWDFDWGTFIERKVNGWKNDNALWYSALLNNQSFRKRIQDNWTQYKNSLKQIPQFIDSLADYIKESNDRNIVLWPISIQSQDFPDKDKSFSEAIAMMKHTYSTRIAKLDSLFYNL